jgi:DNA-binding transcriptional LysR family regulator
MGAEVQVLQRDVLVAAIPRTHRLASQQTLSLADLAGETFVMYDSLQAEGMRSVCMMACQRAGFVPRVAQEAIQVKTVLALVESGLGIALVPSMTQQVAGEDVVCRPLAELAHEQVIGYALAYQPQPANPTVDRLRALARLEFPEGSLAEG